MNVKLNFPASRSQAVVMKAEQLVERLARAGNVETVFMRKFVKEVITVIEEGLLRDGVVKIHNFGIFRLNPTPIPKGVDAETGKPVVISGRPQVVFHPDKKIRELIDLALSPALPPGSRISLQTLLEKHLKFSAAPVGTVIEEPAPEFDIVETFPEVHKTLSPAFVMAEDEADKEQPGVEELKLGEVISEPTSDMPPAFTFAETAEEPVPTFSTIEAPPEPPRPSISRRRPRRFAWYASAAAVFLLLLLFVLSGRISEQSGSVPSSGAGAVSSSISAPTRSSPQDGIKSRSTAQTPADKALSTPPYESAAYFAGGTHQVAAGDNLWRISGTYYRDYYLWPNIYRANTANIHNPDILQIDQSLEVPVLYGPPEKLTATDRRNVAEGYFLLYRYYKENNSALAPYALWTAVQYDAQIKTDYAAELREDDLAFLQAHGVRRALAER